MFNSKFIFILFVNAVLFTLAVMLFAGNKTVLTVTQGALAKIESKMQSIPIADNHDANLDPLFNPVAPLPLVIETKESREALKRLTQKMRKELAARTLLQTQLTLVQQQNKRLQAQINNLDGELETQSRYITVLEKNNSERQNGTPEEHLLIASDSDLLKTNIQSQPDLIAKKSHKGDAPSSAHNGHESLEKAADNFSGAVEFGFSYEQDNKVTRSLDGRLVLDYEQVSQYKLNSNFKFEMSEEDSEKSTEKYRWQLQADYNLDPRNLVFARSDINRSKFASYEKEDIYTVGYGRIIFDDSKHKFNMEIGPGYRMADPNDGENALSIDEFIVRTRFNYERVVSTSLQLIVNTVWEMGNENSIYSANFKAQNKIYRELYLIFDLEYKYTQNVPIDTLNKEVSTGLKLLYAF